MERIPEFIGNHLFLVSLFVALLALLLWNLFGDALSGVAQLAPAEVTLLLNRENALLLDVRTAAEFGDGHILGAVNMPAAEIETRQKELERYRDRPVVACCANGTHSTRVVRALRLQGIGKVHCLKGGLAAWRAAGLPLTRGGE